VNLLRRKALVAVGFTAAALLLLGALAGHYVMRMHLWGMERLQELEPRQARMLGLRESAAGLDDALKQVRAALPRLGHSADRDAAQVGNDLQQLARRALQAAGLVVASSQVLPPRAGAGFERIAVTLQADGPLSGVQVALAALQGESPRLALDSVVLQSSRRSADDGSPVVSCRLTVSVLRLQP
jgi:general secretion pathway protein M